MEEKGEEEYSFNSSSKSASNFLLDKNSYEIKAELSQSSMNIETLEQNADRLDSRNFDITLFKQRTQKILIVDDEQYNIDALKIILKYHCNIDSDSICDKVFDGK